MKKDRRASKSLWDRLRRRSSPRRRNTNSGITRMGSSEESPEDLGVDLQEVSYAPVGPRESVEGLESKRQEDIKNKELMVGNDRMDDSNILSAEGDETIENFGDSEPAKSVSFEISSSDAKSQESESGLNEQKEQLTQYYISGGSGILNAESRFTFNQYELPEKKLEEVKQSRTDNKHAGFSILTGKLKEIDLLVTVFTRKFVVLLSRSSGLDKVAAFTQYASLATGDLFARYFFHRRFFREKVMTVPDLINLLFNPIDKKKLSINKDLAWWDMLEDSMSAGRKVLRLFKWVKEIERARLAMSLPAELLMKAKNNFGVLFQRGLQLFMHVFAGLYYFSDNLIWAAQIGLINRAAKDNLINPHVLKQMKSWADFSEMREGFFDKMRLKQAAEVRIDRWKDIRNYSSLWRLIFAIVNSSIQILSFIKEIRRLNKVYAKRIAAAQYLFEDDVPNDLSSSLLTREETDAVRIEAVARKKMLRSFASVDGREAMDKLKEKVELDINWDDLLDKSRHSPRLLRIECEVRVKEIRLSLEEQKQDLLAATCNLLMILNRLKFRYFEKIPLYLVGVFGSISGVIGILKNWPKKVQSIKVDTSSLK